MRNVYCLFDNVANAVVGALVCNSHDAPVIRMFHDLLDSDPHYGKHAGDYDMRRIGQISDDGIIDGEAEQVIATGTQWQAARTPQIVKEA